MSDTSILNVPTADWATLFDQLPVAVEQLESHDARFSPEAAIAIRLALHILSSTSTNEAYWGVTCAIHRLAKLGATRRDGHLPLGIVNFLSGCLEQYDENSLLEPRDGELGPSAT